MCECECERGPPGAWPSCKIARRGAWFQHLGSKQNEQFGEGGRG